MEGEVEGPAGPVFVPVGDTLPRGLRESDSEVVRVTETEGEPDGAAESVLAAEALGLPELDLVARDVSVKMKEPVVSTEFVTVAEVAPVTDLAAEPDGEPEELRDKAPERDGARETVSFPLEDGDRVSVTTVVGVGGSDGDAEPHAVAVPTAETLTEGLKVPHEVAVPTDAVASDEAEEAAERLSAAVPVTAPVTDAEGEKATVVVALTDGEPEADAEGGPTEGDTEEERDAVTDAVEAGEREGLRLSMEAVGAIVSEAPAEVVGEEMPEPVARLGDGEELAVPRAALPLCDSDATGDTLWLGLPDSDEHSVRVGSGDLDAEGEPVSGALGAAERDTESEGCREAEPRGEAEWDGDAVLMGVGEAPPDEL